MARQKGIIHATGRIGNCVGYLLNGKYVLRSLPKSEGRRAKWDASYAGARETSTEFGKVSRAGKFFRETLKPFVGPIAQRQLDNPVNKLLSAVKNKDTSPRGERTVGNVLQTPASACFFTGFEFNSHFLIRLQLRCSLKCDPISGTLLLGDFLPKRDLKLPTNATHVQLSACCCRLDFTMLEGAISLSSTITLTIETTETDVLLAPTPLPTGEGIILLVLKVVFIERTTEMDYVLNGGAMVV